MKFGKRKEKEINVSISEVTTISPVFYNENNEEIKIWNGYSNSGLTYKIVYKKIKRYKVESFKYYNNGDVSTLFTTQCETKEEAEGLYNDLLNLNGELCIEKVIDNRKFIK